MRHRVIALFLLGAIVGCDGGEETSGPADRFENTPEGGACNASSLCAEGLVCQEGVCVSEGTAGWEDDTRLTFGSESSYRAYNGRSIAAGEDNTLHVTWYEVRNGRVEILYRRSLNNGQNWEPETTLSTGPVGVDPEISILTGEGETFTLSTPEGPNPTIAVSGPLVHVAWRADPEGAGNAEILYKRSRDHGATWEGDIRLTRAAHDSILPSLVASGDHLHLVWVDLRDQIIVDAGGERTVVEELYYKGSSDGGTTWSADRRITQSPAPKGFPDTAVVGNRIFVVWIDHRDGNWEIYYKLSTDASGTSWGNDARLTNDFGISEVPAVAVSGNDIHVVWADSRGEKGPEPDAYIDNYEIYYRHSPDGGTTWDEEVCFCTNDAKPPGDPDIAVSGSEVHVVYPDARDFGARRRQAMNTFEIYYRYSPDGGTSWFDDVRLTFDTDGIPFNSRLPNVAATPSTIHLVWEEWRDGNAEVYYKRRSLVP